MLFEKDYTNKKGCGFMRGERYSFDDIKELKNGTKVWIEQEHKNSDLFIIKKVNYGISVSIDKEPTDLISFFLHYKKLEIKMNNGDIKIYEWLSNEEYLMSKIENLRNNIEIALILENRTEFIILTTKYNELLKKIEERKLESH